MRLEDYDWKGLPPDLTEWLQDATDILNQGKYQVTVGSPPVSGTTPGNSGDVIVALDGATYYIYINVDGGTTWKKATMA